MTHQRNTSPDQLQGWFAGRLPADWFTGAPEVEADRDEVIVVGTLAQPELPDDAGDDPAEDGRSPGAGHPGGCRGGPEPKPCSCVVRAAGRRAPGRVAGRPH